MTESISLIEIPITQTNLFYCMLYKHRAYFVPVGETFKSASDVKEVIVESNEILPDENERKSAKRILSNKIDAYSARNYWELGKFVSTYSEETKLSDTTKLRDFLINLDWANKTEMKSSASRKYIAVKHQMRLSGSKILDDLEEYTDKSGIHMYADRQSTSMTRVYVKWETKDI